MVALVVSVALAFGTKFLIQGSSDSGTATAMTQVLVATKDLAVGTRMDKHHMRWQDWPREHVQNVFITKDQGKEADHFVGGVVKDRVAQGEPILKSDIVTTDESVLSAVIDQGTRAYTIPLDRRSSVSGKIMPNDLVDVIVASRDRETRSYVARTVVQKVRVLEVNSALDAEEAEETSGDKSNIKSITVQVTPRQAETLAGALKGGTPVISLHSFASKASNETDYVQHEEVEEEITVMRGDDVQKVNFNK